MDAAVLTFRRQRGSPLTSCASLQPRARADKAWSLTSLKEKLIKIGAKIVSHGRYIAFQMSAIPRNLFAEILRLIGGIAAASSSINSVRLCCFAFRATPRERCVLMTEKLALLAQASRGARGAPYLTHTGDDFILSREPNSGKLWLLRSPIWGTPVEAKDKIMSRERSLRNGAGGFFGVLSGERRLRPRIK
jgi:hypothetical protein